MLSTEKRQFFARTPSATALVQTIQKTENTIEIPVRKETNRVDLEIPDATKETAPKQRNFL